MSRFVPVSFDGVAINDGLNFEAVFPSGGFRYPAEAKIDVTERSHYPPVTNSKIVGSKQFPLTVICLNDRLAQRDTLMALFSTLDTSGPKKLIVADHKGIGGQYYVYVYVLKVARIQAAAVTFILQCDEPFLRGNVETVETWQVTASGDTHTMAVLGNLPASPKIDFKPTNAKGGGFSYKRWVPLYNKLTVALTDYPLDLGNAAFDSAALVGAGHVQASGNDFRLYIGSVEVSRWLSAWNTANTKIWTRLASLGRSIEMTLASNILANATEIPWAATTANDTLARLLPATNGIVMIGSEAYTYTAVNLTARKLTGCTPGAKGTTSAGHTAGAIIRWIPLDIWLYYGDTTLGAPTATTTYKPLFDLDASTNSSWVFAQFSCIGTPMIGGFVPAIPVNTGGASASTYTSDHEAIADPAVDMGMRLTDYFYAGLWRAASGTIYWTITNPCLITQVAANGEKWKSTATNGWPLIARCEYSNDGITWISLFAIAAPAAINNWENWTQTTINITNGAKLVRFNFNGSLAIVANGKALMEVDAVTLTLDATKTPVAAIGAEQALIYPLGAVLTNTDSGEWLQVTANIDRNETARVDTELKLATYLKDNSVLYAAIVPSSLRYEWFELKPGTVHLKFEDVGTAGVEVKLRYEERHTF